MLIFVIIELFLLYFPSLKKKLGYEIAILSVCAFPFLLLNQWADFHETLYEPYAIRDHTNFVVFNFLHH